MVKRGGPCQAPGAEKGSICGITEISDRCDWRKGGKFKPEHKGKACCTKRQCRIALGVIPDTELPKEEAAPAPAPAAGGGLSGLVDVVCAALSGQSAPAAAPAAASATAPSASAAPAAQVAAAGRRGARGEAAASAAVAAAAVFERTTSRLCGCDRDFSVACAVSAASWRTVLYLYFKFEDLGCR